MNLHVAAATGLQGLTMRFAAFAEALHYTDLPTDVREKAKLIIRDGIGNQIAASAISVAAIEIVNLLSEWGGQEQSTVIGYGRKLPAPLAAMCNGAMGHGVELDDAHGSGLIKAGSVLIPAMLAAAELGKANGEDAIAALVGGYDIAVRIAKAINPGHRQRGYHTTSTVSLIGAAAITARLLGGNTDQIASAMGLAAMQSSGIQAYLDDPCMAKPFGPGKSAFNGVLAGVLAMRGFTGPKKALESSEGFFNAFTSDVRASDLTDGFGQKFAIMEVGFKPHAACRYAHGPIDIAQDLHGEGVDVGKVRGIRVRMSRLAIRQASKFPCPNLNAAMGSTQFGVALALACGSNGLKDYWDGYKKDAVHQLASRVELVEEPEYGLGGRQAALELEIDGVTLVRRQEEPRGEPTNPMSRGQLDDKFASTAGLVLDKAAIAQISDKAMNLEKERDLSRIISLAIAPGGEPKLLQA